MSKVLESKIEAYDSGNNLVVAEGPKGTWRRHIWDSLDKPPEERKFLFKLDAGLLSIACLGKSLVPGAWIY
jgi:MFS transporter, ACS family, pantothenate transporter